MNMAELPVMPDTLTLLNDVLMAVDALPTKIEHATVSSRAVLVGSLFLAYPGAAHDGRRYINDAVARGAAAVLCEAEGMSRQELAAISVPVITVAGLKNFASAIGAHVCHHPSEKLWMVGVTGTNGKTSVAQWVAHALQLTDRRTAVIGTIGSGMVGAMLGTSAESSNTTPDGVLLQHMLREFVDAGAVACAMEVSSHGLDQGRVDAVKFDVAIFTNLTRDHLDYHGSMENYGEAKAKLFAMRGLKAAVVNVDDAMGRGIVQRVAERGVEVIRFAVDDSAGAADLVAKNLAVSASGLVFDVCWQGGNEGASADAQADVAATRVQTSLLGAFNVSNLLAVIGALMASGIALSVAARLAGALPPVPGRMQAVGRGHNQLAPLVVVDYAHTPDALEKALTTLAAIVPDKARLIAVFGCGGDRDRGKRALMGAVSAKYADCTIITSDNPRSENAEQILQDIAAGMGDAPRQMIADRRAAIFAALNMAQAEDVVLIAGKGHEDYQIIGTAKNHFSDVEVAAEVMAAWPGRGT